MLDKIGAIVLIIMICFVIVVGIVAIGNRNKMNTECIYSGYAGIKAIDKIPYCYRYVEGKIDLIEYKMIRNEK